jgi:hypothetical protein
MNLSKIMNLVFSFGEIHKYKRFINLDRHEVVLSATEKEDDG